MVRIIVLSC